MTKILINGSGGAMGHVVADVVAGREDTVVAAGIDPDGKPAEFAVFSHIRDCNVKADVLVDFSHPSALTDVLAFGQQTGTPLVIATTGLTENQIAALEQGAETLPIFFSYNMSLGVNLLVELTKIATRLLGQDFDIEIVEKHHRKKIDAPSGTALMLADGAASAMNEVPDYVYSRHQREIPRPKNEIGISAIRGGTIVGDHDVIFAGRDEVITLSHQAQSKEIFAVGAVNAAQFLAQQSPGLYTMADLIK